MKKMNGNEVLDLTGEFLWSFCDKFYIKTSIGNFIWSDPDYQGDNTLRETKLSLKDWCNQEHLSTVRHKGTHTIREYCGDKVMVIYEE